MQIHRYGYGIKGFGRFSDYGLRFLAMVSDKAQQRYRALLFREKYGLEATMEAFKVKRRTLYYAEVFGITELDRCADRGETRQKVNDSSFALRVILARKVWLSARIRIVASFLFGAEFVVAKSH